MKKITALCAAALLLTLSLAGCGGKDTETAQNNSGDNTYSQDVEQNYSKSVDMEKVDGKEATSDTAEDAYIGTISEAEVSIGSVKVIDYEGDKVAVVSFEFKNTDGDPKSFSSALRVTAEQNGDKLAPAVVYNVEGVEPLSAEEYVEKGDTITVQRSYRLNDESPLTISVTDAHQTDESVVLGKVFDL